MTLVLGVSSIAAGVTRFSAHPANNAVELKTKVLDQPVEIVPRLIVPTSE